jgi:hypothetical protein
MRAGDEFYDDEVTSGPLVDREPFDPEYQSPAAIYAHAHSASVIVQRIAAFVEEHESHWLFAHPSQPSIGCNNCCRVLGPGDLR